VIFRISPWLVFVAMALAPLACKQKTGAAPDAGPAIAVAPGSRKPEPLKTFAAFKADGSQLAYVVPFGGGGALGPYYVAYATPGDPAVLREDRFDLNQMQKVVSDLRKNGFDTPPHDPPTDVELEAHLAATPPTLVLTRGSAHTDVKLPNAAYGEDFVAEIWALSPDEKLVAIHVGVAPGSMYAQDARHVVLLAPLP
jgi:hypothetical protein